MPRHSLVAEFWQSATDLSAARCVGLGKRTLRSEHQLWPHHEDAALCAGSILTSCILASSEFLCVYAEVSLCLWWVGVHICKEINTSASFEASRLQVGRSVPRKKWIRGVENGKFDGMRTVSAVRLERSCKYDDPHRPI